MTMRVCHMYSLLDVVVESGIVHMPKLSDWMVASTSGWDVSAGTPEVKLAINAGLLTVPSDDLRMERRSKRQFSRGKVGEEVPASDCNSPHSI